MKRNLKNQFFDINKFPATGGILVFPISLSKLSNAQSAEKCYKYMEHFTQNRKAVVKPLVGLNFIYGDYLYFHSDESASLLRNRFSPLISGHKNNFLKLLKKNPWYIEKAFNFTVWNQILLENKDFANYFGNLKKIYKKDKEFQKWIEKDLHDSGKKVLTENQLNFFLEEILVFYLLAKGKIPLHNDFVHGHEEWILSCYPGAPLYSEIYLFQKNFFKLQNPGNKYENCYYDLDKKILYDYSRVDLNSFNP